MSRKEWYIQKLRRRSMLVILLGGSVMFIWIFVSHPVYTCPAFRAQRYHRGVYGSGLRVKVMSEFRIWGRGSGVCRDATDLISRHIQSINLVQGNLLHRTIFVSDIEVNV